MQQNIEDADMVLIVCSERYKRLFERCEVVERGGYGVTWESAIITSDLYQSRLNNQRFYPILPDDGDQQHAPAMLMDWDNNHRFPSGMGRILSLIRDEVIVPAPQNSCSIYCRVNYPDDMHGNVDEWVEDDWHDSYKDAPDGGSAWIDQPRGSSRVFRGGSWYYSSRCCRSASRGGWVPHFCTFLLGFRLVLHPGQPG
jgi:hypothetical protein